MPGRVGLIGGLFSCLWLGDNGEFSFIGGFGLGRRPGRGSGDGYFFGDGLAGSRFDFGDGIHGSDGGGALFVTISQFGVARGLFGISGFGVDVLQGAAADSGFCKASGPRV